MSNILVIGGAGYLGTVLVDRLVKRGHEVTIYGNLEYGQDSLPRLDLMIDRDMPVTRALLAEVNYRERPKNFRLVQGSTTNDTGLKEIIRPGVFEYVFHFGELVGEDCCDKNPSRTRYINTVATANVFNLVQEAVRD